MILLCSIKYVPEEGCKVGAFAVKQIDSPKSFFYVYCDISLFLFCYMPF